MSIHARHSFLGGIVALVLVAGGCSRSSAPNTSPTSASGAPLASVSSAPPSATLVEANSPCRLLTDAEVRAVFPSAKSGVPERSREEYGIKACVWDLETDRFVVQTWAAEGGNVGDEIRGLAAGFVDPLNAAAPNNIRYETLAGVGNQAMALVETQDDKRGILSDVALLVAKRGDQILEVQSQGLPRRARATALQALTTLGREAVARM